MAGFLNRRQHAGELRTELDRAHQTSQAATAQLDQVRGELAKVQAKAAATEAHRMAERDQATKAAGQAREEAARMAGQIETLKEQSAALLARITPAEAKPTRKKPGGE